MRWQLLLGPVNLVLLWTSITAAGFVRPIFLPSPWQVFSTLVSLLADGPLWQDAGATLYRTCIAFLIAAALGLIVGVPLGVWRKLHESIEVLLDFFRSMPSPALIPLAMLLFGLGDLLSTPERFCSGWPE